MKKFMCLSLLFVGLISCRSNRLSGLLSYQSDNRKIEEVKGNETLTAIAEPLSRSPAVVEVIHYKGYSSVVASVDKPELLISASSTSVPSVSASSFAENKRAIKKILKMERKIERVEKLVAKNILKKNQKYKASVNGIEDWNPKLRQALVVALIAGGLSILTIITPVLSGLFGVLSGIAWVLALVLIIWGLAEPN